MEEIVPTHTLAGYNAAGLPLTHRPTRVREKVMRRFKSARHLQRFTSVHDQVANLFMHCSYNTNAQEKRSARTQAFEAWEGVTGHLMLDRLAA
jgi:putative transposase